METSIIASASLSLSRGGQEYILRRTQRVCKNNNIYVYICVCIFDDEPKESFQKNNIYILRRAQKATYIYICVGIFDDKPKESVKKKTYMYMSNDMIHTY